MKLSLLFLRESPDKLCPIKLSHNLCDWFCRKLWKGFVKNKFVKQIMEQSSGVEENEKIINQVKIPKFEVKPFSGILV